MLAALLLASWSFIEWTDDGADRYPGGTVLRDDAGNVLRVSLGEGDVDCRPYYQASRDDWIVRALVAVEDGTFFEHRGVRPLSMLRAFCQNVICRRRISGASTITMQTVRLISPHPKTYWWKFKEAILALKMERKKDKLWILSQYLNRAPYGSNFVGIEAAARGWFGKGAKELGIAEAATLAGMVQAPSRFRPDHGLERALKRRAHVLARMQKLGFITAEQAEAARAVRPVVCRSPRPFKAPYFCDWYLRQLRRNGRDALCRVRNGRDALCRVRTGDIVTTLNADLQHLAEGAVQRAADAGCYSVAAVILRTDTGDVKAMACSGDYFDRVNGQVNTAVAPRPAGSTLKPFLLALALDRGLVTPEERLADVPTAFKGYRPANFDASYRGLVTARDALVLSLNIPFVQLLRRVGIPAFGTHLRELGFAHLGSDDSAFGLGMAIGNVEVTLVELANAYATMARGGTLPHEPMARTLSAGACYLVSDMLSGNERSAAALGHVADVPLPRFAWKTGTSSAYRDAWTVAWNPEYVIGVWCGHKYGGFGDTTLVGAKAAAPVAMGIARALYPQNDGPWFVAPREVGRRSVCALTGLPLGASCPDGEAGTFLVGRSANKACDVHVRDASGRVVTRLDPAFAAFSGALDKAQKLQIAQPENDAKIVLVGGSLKQRVVCTVVGNPEGGRLWWLVDGLVVGETRGTQPFAVECAGGRHEILCTTDEGVTATATFTVGE